MTLRLYLKSMHRLLLSSLVLALLATCQVQNFQFPRMGGSYYASSFAHWQASTSTPVAVPGLATVQVIPAKVTLVANDQITPVAVGVPIQIQAGAANEVVTPLSVNCDSQACAMTATFANTHPGGFTFASASGGLDEAIQAAAAQGGGTVVVGSDWSGTTAQIAAAAGNSAVAVLDTRAGASVRYAWNGSQYQTALLISSSGATQVNSIEQIQFADPLGGNSAGGKILAAYQAAGSNGSVSVPASMGDGYPSVLWFPATAYAINQVVADANGNFQQCTTAGTSSSWPGPAWNSALGGTTADGSVVWTRIAGSVYGSVLLDFRTGSKTAPTTDPVPYPYAKIFVPIWDDSSPSNPNSALSYPFQPLANAGPTAFGARVYETGAANPTGMFSDVEENSPGLGFANGANGAAGYFQCSLNVGDTHRGCWGINEGVVASNINQQLFGNEVNLFNSTGSDMGTESSPIAGGGGPMFGFAATNGGGNGGTAGFIAQSQGSGYGWLYGYWALGTRSTGHDFECGFVATANKEADCTFANTTGVATVSQNFPSLPNTFEASAWHATSQPFSWDGGWQYIPDAGTDPKVWLTAVLSENGVSGSHAFGIEANGNVRIANFLMGGYAATPSQTPPVSSGFGGGTGGYAANYDFLGQHEGDFWSLFPSNSSSDSAIAGCWYDGSSVAHCSKLMDRGGLVYSGGLLVATASQLPLSGSVAASTTSLAAGSCGDAVTATVTGATPSMVAAASGEGALPSAGLVLQAAVTATNTVTVEYCNVTAAAIVPAALTIAVRVMQ